MAEERKIEKFLVKEVDRLGGLCVKFPPLFFRGFPDRIVLLPGATIAFVELKAPGEKPTLIQRNVQARLRKLGFRVEVLDSKDVVNGFILSL